MLLLTYFAYNEKSSIYSGIYQLLHIFFLQNFISLLQLSFSFSYSCIFQFLVHHVDIFLVLLIACLYITFIQKKKKKKKKKYIFIKIIKQIKICVLVIYRLKGSINGYIFTYTLPFASKNFGQSMCQTFCFRMSFLLLASHGK